MSVIESSTNVELAKIIQGANLPSNLETQLKDTFGPISIEAADLIIEAGKIEVTGADQKEAIGAAHAAAKALGVVRRKLEATREETKRDYLKVGQTIDLIARGIRGPLEEAEAKAKEKSEFAVRAEAARLDALQAERWEKLRAYTPDPSLFTVRHMSDEEFGHVLNGQRLAYEARQEAAQKAEADRIAAEEAKRIEAARIREENERLEALAAEQEAALKAEREAAAKAQREADEKARIAREEAAAAARAAQAKADAEKAAIEAKAKAEREEAARVARVEADRLAEVARKEREAREKLEAENKAREAAEAKRKADELAAAKKAAQAPDAEKLRALAKAYAAIQIPVVTAPSAQDDLHDIAIMVKGLVQTINLAAEALEAGR